MQLLKALGVALVPLLVLPGQVLALPQTQSIDLGGLSDVLTALSGALGGSSATGTTTVASVTASEDSLISSTSTASSVPTTTDAADLKATTNPSTTTKTPTVTTKAPVPSTTSSTGGSIIDILTGLLSSIGPLLSLIKPETFTDAETVLKNAAYLLDDQGVNNTKTLITNANDLLTPEFVKSVGGLIDALAPLINTISSLLGGIINLFFGGSKS